jgi:hypothetical protein
MALSHTFYAIKVFLSKNEKSLNPLYFDFSVSYNRQLRNAGAIIICSLAINLETACSKTKIARNLA